ncbi:MAG TPA: PQQ-dependent sugar dehydrogenase [Actinomycetota bacterium]
MAELEQPLAMAVRPDDDALYVAEKVGRVVAVRDGSEPEVVLDISDEVSLGSEQGLLGIAFSPDGRFLYANFTDVGEDTRVVEYRFGADGVDLGSRRELLFVEQPFSNHNGGNLAFGPDGYLYIGLGDGGSAGDPSDNAQTLTTPLGKMLRISPRPSGGDPYGIPPDNPFVGDGNALPEIWATGLRNPWRYTFDRETGDLWIGDVGQSALEEIDLEPAGSPGGSNFGWNRFEGTQPFEGSGALEDAIFPVHEYPHTGACAVTGGYVYRGSEIPDLVGAYIYADFCFSRLQAFVPRDGRAGPVRAIGPRVASVASFGQDGDGELYVLSLLGPVYRIVDAGS